jgi:tetratricopeptide (TPR) repeat protein
MRKSVSMRALVVCATLAAVIAGCYSTQVSSGILYQRQDNHVKAAKMFREALWYREDDAAGHFYLAESLCILAKGHVVDGQIDSAMAKLTEAHGHFLRAAELDPEEFDVTPDGEDIKESNIQSNYAYYFNQAVKYNQADAIQDAITHFELAYAIDPRGAAGFDAKNLSIKLRMNLADKLSDEGGARQQEMEKLLAELEKAKPATSEQKADWTNTKANALNALGRTEEAGAIYEQLLAEHPDDLALLNRVAQIRIGAGDRSGGAELYQRILNLAENDPNVTNQTRFNYVYSALVNQRDMENYGDVISLSEKALAYASDPNQEYLCYFNMARAHYQLEEWPLAIERAEKAISIKDDQAAVWQVYYLSLSRAGRTDEAQTARQRWQELDQQG